MDYYFARYKVKQIMEKHGGSRTTRKFHNTVLLKDTHPIEFENTMQDRYGSSNVAEYDVIEEWTLLNWNKIPADIYNKHKGRYE